MTQHPNASNAIREMQRCLRALSYTDPAIPPPPVDGVSGNATRASVAAFQAEYGLPVTGVADAATWDALHAACRQNAVAVSPSAPLYLFPRTPVGYTVSAGDEGALVSVIQYLLRETLLGFGQDTGERAVNGSFDPATETAVIAFQRVHSLPETGEVNTATWNRLVAEQNNHYREYS